MELVADTNIWYDLGAGTISASSLKRSGRRLLATPVNHIEICSNLTPVSFASRQAAAKALLAHADDILPDPETHLAAIWGVKRVAPVISIRADLQALADATSPIALSTTVPLYPGSSAQVAIGLSRWRTDHWNDFCDGISQAIESVVPGYKKARATGKVKRLPGKHQPAFRNSILSPQFEMAVLVGTYSRVLHSVGGVPGPPTPMRLKAARPQLSPYAAAYARYIIGCACDFPPEPNDFGDLESFLYLQGRNVLLTSDKRWHRVANAAGYGKLLVRPRDL